MLRQVQKALNAGGIVPRAGVMAAIGILALSLGACSIWDRVRPGSRTGAEIKNPPGSNEPYPSLGEVRERPAQNETADSRHEIAKSLVADREAAKYTDQALRGGTEPSASPPPPPVSSVEPLSTEGTASIDQKVKTADNKTEAKKPSFFGRLFGHKEEAAPVSSEPAPLPAQPTGAVDVQQAAPVK